jgi:hypothetical protein
MVRRARKSEPLDEPESASDAGLEPLAFIPPEKRTDPNAYVQAGLSISNAAYAGKIKAVDAARLKDFLSSDCESNTGIGLEDAQREKIDPLLRVKNLFESSEAELLALEEAVREAAAADPFVLNKWLDMIRRTLRLQRLAKADPVLFFVYVCRDQEDGAILRMRPFHCKFFRVWFNKEYRHSMLWAPPGHAKSTCLRGAIAYEIGTSPQLRHYFVTDASDKATKETRRVKAIVKSKRFSALFPDVRVLGKSEGEEDSATRFSVTRPNWQSKESTFEAGGYLTRVQGSGFDRIWADDIVPQSAMTQPSIRRDVQASWDGVIEQRIRNTSIANIRITGHPWHENDLLCNIQRRVKAGSLPGWLVETEAFAIKDGADGRPIPIWPERFSVEHLESKKNNPILYSLQYRLCQQIESMRAIRWLKFFPTDQPTLDAVPEYKARLDVIRTGERWLSVDPSATALRGSSETGIVEAFLTQQANGKLMYITDAWFLRLAVDDSGGEEYNDLRGFLLDRILKADPPYTGIIIEAQGGIKGMTSAFIGDIRRVLREKGFKHEPQITAPGTRISTRTNTSKLDRLHECKGLLERGLVRFAGSGMATDNRMSPTGKTYRFVQTPGTGVCALTDQILSFTGTNRGDGVDAATQLILKFAPVMETEPVAIKHEAPQGEQEGISMAARRYYASLEKAMKNPPTDADQEAMFYDDFGVSKLSRFDEAERLCA